MSKVGLEETWDTTPTGRGITQGVGIFLQDGGAGDSTVWVRYVGPFGSSGEEDGRDIQ